jgi:hypothetical protein
MKKSKKIIRNLAELTRMVNDLSNHMHRITMVSRKDWEERTVHDRREQVIEQAAEIKRLRELLRLPDA